MQSYCEFTGNLKSYYKPNYDLFLVQDNYVRQYFILI